MFFYENMRNENKKYFAEEVKADKECHRISYPFRDSSLLICRVDMETQVTSASLYQLIFGDY